MLKRFITSNPSDKSNPRDMDEKEIGVAGRGLDLNWANKWILGNGTGEVRRYIYKGGGIYGVRAKSIFVVIDFGDGGADEECA